ncbi:MAG TPA: bifunctional alpha,alpha-trehalose-phosphate synthase (UDP-forming)/trehalose-phosphatase [Polyangiaceae bacterium]|jgi:trehalose 6-phosphate synthase/phosphatase|nr:bifunctional alpha,alpha-trehalose-phosphate synthase (UDP-forming)/trehalose-phosphatase [Polyangiaceae bacterium]
MSRLILVANRLPVSVDLAGGGVEIHPSNGGLASGMRGLGQAERTSWVGWPGGMPNDEQRAILHQKLKQYSATPVYLSSRESKRFYEGMSNSVIWPLFHYLIDRLPLLVEDFDEYAAVNQRFADCVCAHASEDDLIWIHDYHLLLLPQILRARLPRARIGFFLHVPFPSSEVFRLMPHREELLHGMLGANLIGFHTFSYARHFGEALLGNLGIEPELDRVDVEGRNVSLGVFPMGIDVASFERLAASEQIAQKAHELKQAQDVERLLLGVDRLDYTKGLPRKLLAMERLLDRSPQYRGKIRLLQIAVPTRENVEQYRNLRQEVEQLVGRINGAHASLHASPIHYVYQTVTQEELVASYRATDIMVVTPLRDGMNLVAKEYVASRTDGDGVLVLSELAGAASELGEALTVNPYDVASLAETLDRALQLPEAERRERMAALREKVSARPVELWAKSFVDMLAAREREVEPRDLRRDSPALDALARELAQSPEVVLALDYDGTLVPIARNPELARPDPALCELLATVAAVRGVRVCVVSGRAQTSLSAWLGDLPIDLVAEHGVWTKLAHAPDWKCHIDRSTLGWMNEARAILETYVERAPGARLEEKTAGLAWHYRNADPYLGVHLARELRVHLVRFLAQFPVSILGGRKVIELRPQGIDKGIATRDSLRAFAHGARVCAMGDDRTDEDLFAALPAGSQSFCAGTLVTRAQHRISGPEQVRRFLRKFVEERVTAC